MHRVRSNFFRIDHGVDPIFETVVPRTLYMAEIPDNVKKEMKIIPVSEVSEVLKEALVKQPKKKK